MENYVDIPRVFFLQKQFNWRACKTEISSLVNLLEMISVKNNHSVVCVGLIRFPTNRKLNVFFGIQFLCFKTDIGVVIGELVELTFRNTTYTQTHRGNHGNLKTILFEYCPPCTL